MMTETEKPKSRIERESDTHTKKITDCYKDTEMKKVYENPRVHSDVMRERDHVVHSHSIRSDFFPFLKRIPKKRSKC